MKWKGATRCANIPRKYAEEENEKRSRKGNKRGKEGASGKKLNGAEVARKGTGKAPETNVGEKGKDTKT